MMQWTRDCNQVTKAFEIAYNKLPPTKQYGETQVEELFPDFVTKTKSLLEITTSEYDLQLISCDLSEAEAEKFSVSENAEPMKVTLHFYNNVKRQTSDKILIFLQPVTFSADYNSFAWRVLNPGIQRHQEAILENTFSGSIATYNSPVGDYSEPANLNLGEAKVIKQLGGQSSTITNDTRPVDPNLVGLYNDGEERLSVIWYVNNNKVVQTNNTEYTTFNSGKYSTFQLKQSIYVMLAQEPTETQTYKLQTYGNLQEFAISSSATDMYFEVFTDDKGGDKFKETDKQKFEALQKKT
ncbi:MAG: hypothetical protein P2A85_23870 [Microcoleus anatoxicus]|uniref:hypothetical protein n=1 Tax=Microcoleus anatoxicus TaxID=2705319 RepID=UPI00366DCC90